MIRTLPVDVEEPATLSARERGDGRCGTSGNPYSTTSVIDLVAVAPSSVILGYD